MVKRYSVSMNARTAKWTIDVCPVSNFFDPLTINKVLQGDQRTKLEVPGQRLYRTLSKHERINSFNIKRDKEEQLPDIANQRWCTEPKHAPDWSRRSMSWAIIFVRNPSPITFTNKSMIQGGTKLKHWFTTCAHRIIWPKRAIHLSWPHWSFLMRARWLNSVENNWISVKKKHSHHLVGCSKDHISAMMFNDVWIESCT